MMVYATVVTKGNKTEYVWEEADIKYYTEVLGYTVIDHVELDDSTQYMVHSYDTDSVVFRGTENECARYINEHPNNELEIYWANLGQPHFSYSYAQV